MSQVIYSAFGTRSNEADDGRVMSRQLHILGRNLFNGFILRLVSVPQSSVVCSLRWDTTARGKGEKSNYNERTSGGHGTERKQDS